MSADGILVVNKPRGPTSHDVVASARRVLGTRAVGHAGTLDPMASGVLVLLVGQATKLAAHLTLDDKEYRATVSFGRSTNTLDAEGQTTEERALHDAELGEAALEAALLAEAARTEQVPPGFSAISVDGHRAHRLARRGVEVVLPARPVAVRGLALVDRDAQSVTVDLIVSKGYYVRAFARDLGAALGAPAHLAALERRASGPYRLEEAVPWPPPSPPSLLPLAEAATRALPSVRVTEEGVTRALCGKALFSEHFIAPPESPELTAWLDAKGRLIALGRPGESGAFRVVRGFPPDPSTH